MLITGQEINPSKACSCSDSFLGDRIFVEDNSFIDSINGIDGCGISIADYLKSISFAEKKTYNLPPNNYMRLGVDANNPRGYKFLAMVIQPEHTLYWNHIDSFLNGSLNFTYSIDLSFTELQNDMVKVNGTVTLSPDNGIKNPTWSNIANINIDGNFNVNWVDALIPWNSVSPIKLTNSFITEDITFEINSMVTQDDNGVVNDTITTMVTIDGIILNLTLNIDGLIDTEDPNNSVMQYDVSLDMLGRYVANFAISTSYMSSFTSEIITSTITGDMVTTNATRFRKATGLLIFSSDDVENIDDLMLYNPGITTNMSLQILLAG